ncbi:MAG: 1,4-alpha-glucan branching protein domain-containing protein [Acidimicrobiia bacterium]
MNEENRTGRLVIVLHCHLPYVLGEGIWPHGESWLFEAAAETYLPLLMACDRLAEEGIRPGFTIEISPVLGEQLDDPRFRDGFPGFLDTLRDAASLDARTFGGEGRQEMVGLARAWEEHFGWLAQGFADRDGDLLGGFARLAEAGQVELATSARTHGLLPMLGSPERVWRQVAGGAAWFEARFGRRPRGIWMPECAYRPGGSWDPVASGPEPEQHRPGNEEFLEEAGFGWTVVDTHLVAGGDPLGSYPAREARLGEQRSPYRLYAIGRSSVVAFPRDPATTLQVWSGEWGYPGNPWYLEFHKKHSQGGLRYWRVSDPETPLEEKRVYEPDRVEAVIGEQADHFAELVVGVMAGAREAGIDSPVVTAPYDAELFGHWWAEGVRWLEEARRALHSRGVNVRTADEAAREVGPADQLALPAGSWGDGGDFRVWDNEQTGWIWQEIYRAERLLERTWDELPEDPPAELEAVVRQLERSVLLIESSDWPFLITTQGAPDYAAERVRRHSEAATRLSLIARQLSAGERVPEELAGLVEDLESREPLWVATERRPGPPAPTHR